MDQLEIARHHGKGSSELSVPIRVPTKKQVLTVHLLIRLLIDRTVINRRNIRIILL
jgi:hypothetical protein